MNPITQEEDISSFNISRNFLESRIPPAASMAVRLSATSAPVPIWLITLVTVASVFGFHVFRNWLNDDEDDYTPPQLESAESDVIDAEKGQESYLFFFTGTVYMTAERFIRLPRVRIGKGVLGSSYKIVFPTGMEVTAKQLPGGGDPSMEEFCEKVQLLSKLGHENLGKIIGCYCSQYINLRMIISEHVDGQSLFDLLHGVHKRSGGGNVLNSTNRLLIAKGIVRGMHYLHRCFAGKRVPHGNLKSSNVIIPSGNSVNPKLVNFGLIPLLPLSEIPRLAIGFTPEFTAGNLTPEEMSMSPSPSPKTDIYCLGILLLELVTGLNPRDGVKELAKWVDDRKQLIDDYDYMLNLMNSGEIENRGSLGKILEMALECTEISPMKRPEMTQLLARIEAI